MQGQPAMRLFEGLVISTSGGNAADKRYLAELITNGAGVYSKDLTRACTHLLVKPAARNGAKLSDKEKAAREWKTIRILSEGWVTDTVAAGRAISEVPYTVLPPEPLQTPQTNSSVQPESNHQQHARLQHQVAPDNGPNGLKRTGGQPQQQQSLPESRLPPQRLDSAAHAAQPQPAACEASAGTAEEHDRNRAPAIVENQSHVSKVPEMPGSQDASICKTAASDMSAPQPSGARQEQSDGDFLSSGRSPQAHHQAPAACASGRDWRQPLEDGEPYLDGLRVYVACAAPSEFMELVSICREGGACRYPRLDPLITHIVVGCDRLADELASLKQHQQRHSALVRVLDAKWLRACSSSRSRAAEGSYLMSPGALMPPSSVSTRDLGVMQGHREASKGAWDGETTRHGSMSISEGQSRAFLDCWFTLAALEADPELQKHMRNVIRKAGGRIFDAGRLNLVTNTIGAYAVCPFGFPAQARREALRHPDFKKVPEANYVTAYWVELSEREMKPVRELGYKRVTCAPLPYSLPMPGMSNIRATSSNMQDEEKSVIIELVSHLGGRYTAKMSRSNTHLIVDRAFGQKWANAAAFGVEAVTTDWLVDSARAGRLLPEKDYVPSAPAPGEMPTAVTQAPFELTARPVEQPEAYARPAGTISRPEEAKSTRGSRQASGPSVDPVLSAACQQDMRQGNQENDPLEGLLAKGNKVSRRDGGSPPSTIRDRQRPKLQEIKASLSKQSHAESEEQQAGKDGEQSEVWEAATRLGNFLEAVVPTVLHGSQLELHDLPQRSASAGASRAGQQMSRLGDDSAGEGASGRSDGSLGPSPNRKRPRTGSLSGTNSAGSSGRHNARAAALTEAPSVQQLQCSQQVGYGAKAGPGVSTRRRAADSPRSNLACDSNAGEKLAKQRLAEAMRSSSRQAGKGASGEDALKLVLQFAE